MSDENQREPTLGEYLVGIDFNPSGDPTVIEVKRMAAEFIDKCALIRENASGESDAGRCASLAITAIEEGAMWAVKAATKKPRRISSV